MGHLNRKKRIAEGIIPPLGTNEFTRYSNYINSLPTDQMYLKKCWEKVNRSLEAQYSSNCGFVTEMSLRGFLVEFNTRAWHHSLWSMPTMFNIMECFFNYKKPEIYFELIEEENYYLSIYDFLDFITSDKFKLDKKLLEDNFTENIIFNFEINNDFDKVTFKTSDNDVFIVRGVSMIRRNKEITISIITGKKRDENDILEDRGTIMESSNTVKSKLIEKANQNLREKELEFEYIDKNKKYIKNIVVTRLDIDTLTIDSRYIGKETNQYFNVTTDDISVFLDKDGHFIDDYHKDVYNSNLKRIEQYNSIYELIDYLVYLPYYFNENNIQSEDLETEFKELINNPIKKRKFLNVFGHKGPVKTVFYVDKEGLYNPSKIVLRDDLFRVQSSGYWKNIPVDEVGMDKKGKAISNRTWVNQISTFFQAAKEDLIVESDEPVFDGPNAGFIYIIRNPTMQGNIFKIGLTRNDVDMRVAQLSKTSVPDKFYKAQEWNVKDCIKAEKEIHCRLASYRVDPRREFFNINYDKAIKVIKEVIEEINK